MIDPLKDKETKESGCSWQKSSLTFGCARLKLIMFILAQFATARTKQFYYVDTLTSTLLATVSARRYVLSAITIQPSAEKVTISSVRTALKKSDNDETSQACLCAMG